VRVPRSRARMRLKASRMFTFLTLASAFGVGSYEGFEAISGKESTRKAMVILAKYKEDTAWATRLEDECDVEVRAYQSASQEEPYFIENLGGEAAKYFAAIEDVYDDAIPPPYMLFLHAHENSWHNGVNATEYICSDAWRVVGGYDDGIGDPRSLAYGEKKHFLHFPSTRVIRVLRRGSNVAAVFIADKKKGSKLKPWFATNNLRQRVSITARAIKIKDNMRGLYFDSECCGQFSTSFSAIKRRPKSFYQRIRKWVTSKGDSIHSNKNQHKPTVEKAKGLEPLWSVIFDATPLYFDTKLTGSFSSIVKVELEKQAKRVATEKAKTLRRHRSRRSTKVT